MSIANISYGSIGDAAGEARAVARKLDSYANGLDRSVYNKLNSYSGPCTSNIQTAKRQVKAKITGLQEKAEAFTAYAADLENLRSECKSTDDSVRSMVSGLTANFKRNHGIRDSKVQNAINYYLTGIVNATPAGRWLGNEEAKADSVKDYIKQSMKVWWNYEGGKQAVTGVLIGGLEVVAGVCSVVAAIAAVLAGGWTVALAAAIVGGVIAAVNGIVNLVNEGRGYYETKHNKDPALGQRRSKEDTLQDTLRRETDSRFWHNVATGVDITDFVCSVIDFIDSGGKLMKNAYKWATGSMADIKNLRVKDILTGDNVKQLWSKLKGTAAGGWREIKTAFLTKDFSVMKEVFFDMGDDLMNNLKKAYGSFDSIKDAADSIKNMTDIPKALLKDGFTFKNVVVDIGLVSVLLPNLNTGELITYQPGSGGIFDYDISALHISDLTGIITDITDLFKDGFGIGENIIDALPDKLSMNCSFSVEVSDITIPDIRLPKFRFGYA